MQTATKQKMSIKEKLALLFYFLLAVSIGLYYLKPDDRPEKEALKHHKEFVGDLREKVKKEKGKYQAEVEKLEKQNQFLKKLLGKSDEKLTVNQSELSELKERLYHLAEKSRDSFVVNDFDSLGEVSKHYVIIAEKRDSLFGIEKSVLVATVQNRDSAFHSCQLHLRQVDTSFHLLAERHSQLADQLYTTQKSLKQKRRNEKLWKGAALMLSGITLTIWIKNQ